MKIYNLDGKVLWEDANVDSLVEANLEGADLAEANLYKANLEGADLIGASLEGAYLFGADLRGANLKGANLVGADLRRANLWGANLYDTCVYSFQLGKHFGFYHKTQPNMEAEGGLVKIGCEGHSLQYWLENYRAMGEKHEYSQQDIEMYGKQLQVFK